MGGKGAITGMANITPRVLVKIYDLFQAGEREQALELAGVVSRSEWAIGKGGILGTKVSRGLSFPFLAIGFCPDAGSCRSLTRSTPFSGLILTLHPLPPAANRYPASRMP